MCGRRTWLRLWRQLSWSAISSLCCVRYTYIGCDNNLTLSYPTAETMSSIPRSGASAAYTGFWVDHDQGRFLTLTNQNAAALLSFLAVAVTFAGNRSWRIIRYMLFQIICRHHKRLGQSTAPTRRLQIILRNVVTAGSALWAFIELLWNRRSTISFSEQSDGLPRSPRSTRRAYWKTSALALASGLHLAAFVAAGILTSRILIGRTVVSKAISSCGQWQARGESTLSYSPSPGLLTYQSLRLNETLDAENYVRNCYPLGVSRGILDCDKLLIRSLPYQLEHGVPCPFGATLCSDRPDDGFAMDSGTISFQDLGLNSKFAKGLSVQRRSVCAVVPDEPFLGEIYPLEGNATMRSYLYYLTPGMDIQGFFYRNENSSATYKLLALHMPFEPANIIKLLRPESNDHDPSIITLRSNGVQFLSTQDDPWFSVHSRVKFDNSSGVVPEMVIYETDHFLNIIACKEATRFCSSLSNECSPWTGLSPSAAHMSRAISIIAGSHVQSGTSEFEEFSKVITLVALSLQYNSLPHSISDRPASSALQAARYYDGIVQHHLEPEQWKVELEYWFAMAMARLQLEIFNTIEKPPGVDELQAYNQWESNGLNSLCGRIKFRSPDHSTLSTTGIVVVLTLVGLLTLVSLLDMILAWVPAQWAKNLIEEWERLENLQLLEELEAWLNRARDSNDLLEIRHETK